MKEPSNLTRRQAVRAAGAAAAVCAASSLAACSDSGSSSQKTSRRVALILSGPANDGGWGQSHYDSLKKACAERADWRMLDPRENASPTEAADEAQSYVDQGIDLIITSGTQFAGQLHDVVSSAAKKRPDVKFLMTNVTPETDLADYEPLDNLEVVLPDYEQLGELAGIVAGLMTSTGKIGFVAGMELTSSKEKYEAYVSAAQKVNPSVTGVADYSAGYTEASEGRKVAKTLIDRDGVDVIWGDASAAESGVRQALEEAGSDSHFNIAQPIDRVSADQPTVIASTVIDWMIGQAMDKVVSGDFGHGNVSEANMANGGVSLGALSDKVPADVQAKVSDYAKKVQDGTL